MTRRTTKLLVPAGLMAGALLAVACGPPRVVPPGGGTIDRPRRPATTDDDHLHGAAPPVRGDAAQRVEPRRHGQRGRHRGATTSSSSASSTTPTKGNQSAPRSNMMAVARTTGDLLPFVANTNGVVRAVISDGFNVYIGGDFTTVNGVQRPRLAKVNAATGALDTSFSPNIPTFVTDLLLVGNKLYVVGQFGQVNGVQRRGAALLDKGTGALDPTFAPNAQSRVNTRGHQPGRHAGCTSALAGPTLARSCSTSTRSRAPARARTSRCSTTTSATSRWDPTVRSTWPPAAG